MPKAFIIYVEEELVGVLNSPQYKSEADVINMVYDSFNSPMVDVVEINSYSDIDFLCSYFKPRYSLN